MGTSSLKRMHAPQQLLPPQPDGTPQAPEAWGGRVVRNITTFISKRFPIGARVLALLSARRALLERVAPLVVVACAMLFLAYVHYQEQQFYIRPGIVGFAEVNTVSAKRLGISNLAVNSPVGYDGQFYFFLAYL